MHYDVQTRDAFPEILAMRLSADLHDDYVNDRVAPDLRAEHEATYRRHALRTGVYIAPRREEAQTTKEMREKYAELEAKGVFRNIHSFAEQRRIVLRHLGVADDTPGYSRTTFMDNVINKKVT
jgi:hypothetical protein